MAATVFLTSLPSVAASASSSQWQSQGGDGGSSVTSLGYGAALGNQIEARLPMETVVSDLSGLSTPEAGAAFSESLVALLLLGPGWEAALDEPPQAERIDALVSARRAAGKRLIPVLVGDAQLPSDPTGPAAALAELQAFSLQPERFRADAEGLIATIEESLAEARFGAAQEWLLEARTRGPIAGSGGGSGGDGLDSAPAPGPADSQDAAADVDWGSWDAPEEAPPAPAPTRSRRRRGGPRKRRFDDDEARQAAEEGRTVLYSTARKVAARAPGLSDADLRSATEAAHWDAVRDADDLDALRDHLARFPDGATAAAARALVERMRWDEIGDGDGYALKGFLTEFPDGAFAAQAKSALAERRTTVASTLRHAQDELDYIDEKARDPGVDVFLSYASSERAVTEALAADLTGAGYSVWWDAGLLAGAEFEKKIRRELDRAQAVIVIWTPSSVTSKWVYAEAQMADIDDKLITVRTAEVAIKSIPMPYNGFHCELVDDREAVRRALEQRGVHPGAAPAAAPAETADATPPTEAHPTFFWNRWFGR